MKLNFKWTQFFLFLFAFGLASEELYARPQAQGNFGLGIIFGDPYAGVSMKYWNSPTTAIDAALSWSSDDWMRVHADYLIHLPKLIEVQQGTMPVYYGIGGFIQTSRVASVGVRVPVGLSYLLPSHPLEFFFELAANLNIVPNTYFFLGAGIGGRYYF